MKPNNNKIIDPALSWASEIADAAEIIRKGGVVCFPTSCLYGLAADAFNPAAIQKVFKIKKRPEHKPLLILVKNKTELVKLVESVPPVAEIIMNKFWPGQITIIFNAKSSLPDTLTAGTRKIGIRIPDHPAASALVNALDNPITGTSANLSSTKGYDRIKNMDKKFTKAIDFILDAGRLAGGIGSTVIDVTVNPPRILRQGAIPSKKILSVLL